MRIAIFVDFFYPELGGTQDSAMLLGRSLAERGHNVSFYVPRYSLKDYAISKLPVGEIDLGEGVEIHRLMSLPFGGPTGQARGVVPTFLRWLAVRSFAPDIIHTNSFYTAGIEAIIAAKLLKKSLVGTSHLAITEFSHYAPGPFQGLFRKYSLDYINWYYNHCDLVSGPSYSLINEMVASGLRKPHIVISNPISPKIFNEKSSREKTSLKAKFGLSANTVVYAGRLATEKCVDVLIKALPVVKKKIPSINLALAGRGADEKNLKELAKRLSVEENVFFLGIIPQPELAELYNASELFSIMSTSETQGMVLLQAMACGLPAIAANSRSLPEYLNKDCGVLVEPGNADTLAQKIILVLKSAEMRRRMGKNVKKYVEQFYAGNIAAKWEKIYGKLISDYNSKR